MPDHTNDKRDSETLVPALDSDVSGKVEKTDEQVMRLPLSLLAQGTEVSDGVPEAFDEQPDSNSIITSAPRQRPRRARRGDTIGQRYIVDGQIGRGGMGRVFKVCHQVLGKAFALKVLRPLMATDQRIREMFYREARLASALSHDHICSIVDFGQDPEFGLFMVMELLQGITLFEKLRTDGPMPPKVACDIMCQVAEALRYIHSKAIVHGDIKSENILLTSTPDRHRVVKLLDFGLARVNIAHNSSMVDGTPEYLSPERIRGQAASKTSDIYALGILFWELLLGDVPFNGDSDEVFRKHLDLPVPSPSERLGDTLDVRADELIARATAKDPTGRHADVAGFMYELRTLMNMLGMETGRKRFKSFGKGKGQDTSKRERALNRNPSRRAQGGAEVFEYAPIPMAAADGQGKVRVANRAFLEFLGVAGDAAGIQLCDSGFLDVYPTLLDDLDYTAKNRCPVKRIIHLRQKKRPVVEVAVHLTPGPSKAAITAGDVHITLHPLRRRPGPDRSERRRPTTADDWRAETDHGREAETEHQARANSFATCDSEAPIEVDAPSNSEDQYRSDCAALSGDEPDSESNSGSESD
ncbi:MAG: protein kinase [Proteobacteria bacterium]|nr:protein kinase [Pseudomonadota bacterium]